MAAPGSSGFVCKATLRDLYLLTDKWIDALGAPDKTAPNPHYRSAPPMQLWAVPRVEEFVAAHQGDPAFAAIQARRRETIATRSERRTAREAQRDQGYFERDGLTQRDALNFVRHECSNYHELLDELTEKPPCMAAGEAYERMKARTNAAALQALQAHPDFAQLDEGVVEQR